MKTKKIIFWAVDCQKDFINSDGALYVEGAESIKPNLKKLTDFARKNNVMVINTKDRHDIDDEELSDNPDFINTFPKHCMKGTDGEEFIKESSPYKEIFGSAIISNDEYPQSVSLNDRNIIISKNKFDVFEGNPHTTKFLNLINPDIVVVYGVATNVCVNYAVLGLAGKGLQVLVIEDAIKELPNLPLDEIKQSWVATGKVTILRLEELFEYLTKENDEK